MPEWIYGTVPYKDNFIAHNTDTSAQTGSVCTWRASDQKVDEKITLGLVQQPNIIIKIYFSFNNRGDKFILNRVITHHDNGAQIGQQGLDSIKILRIDVENEHYS